MCSCSCIARSLIALILSWKDFSTAQTGCLNAGELIIYFIPGLLIHGTGLGKSESALCGNHSSPGCLTEYPIDVYRELDENADDEDIYLDEFADEIDEWVIDAIKAIGLDTAKAVLNAPREMLIEKADLEEDTVDEVLDILRAEFEEN